MRSCNSLRLTFAAAVLVAAAVTVATAVPNPGWPDSHPTAYLGVHIEDISPEVATALQLKDPSGARVTYVDQDGPACRAGLKNDDVIVGFNGAKVQSAEQLGNLIHALAPGQTVTMTIVRRGGQSSDVKVALGSWPHAPARPVAAIPPRSALAFVGPAMAAPPALPDVPVYTVMYSHHGLMVEPLSTQMADFFGVPHDSGVMIRTVEKGSPAAAAGLKACDVIVKINNEPVHDMADWGRAMHIRGGKVSVSIVRDKREQTVVMNLPTPDSSRLENWNPEAFDAQMDVLRQEMKAMDPEFEQAQQEAVAQLDPKELEQMQRELQRSMKLSQEEMAKMQKELRKSMPSEKDLRKMQEDIAKSMPLRADMDKMRQEIAESLKNIPTSQELEQMRHDVEESMKNWTPQLQQQMEELKKQMQQQKLDFQQLMKKRDNEF
ncbi:MAG: PDZ domain-containing protein [Acidobacteriota bacterium]|nr:PDZ domain-containing protein [Acidobacteriota bacterium]